MDGTDKHSFDLKNKSNVSRSSTNSTDIIMVHHAHKSHDQSQQTKLEREEKKYEKNDKIIDSDNCDECDEEKESCVVEKCEPFNVHKPKQPGLRANVFVSKDCTRDLAAYIVDENWGHEYGMLYKYLDYIFRCQIFDKQVKKIKYINNNEIVLFHTGLQRKTDHNFLYFVLKPNDADKRNAEQRWRVPAGKIETSCLSKEEIMDQCKLKK
eukprot:66824_1